MSEKVSVICVLVLAGDVGGWSGVATELSY